MEKFFPARTLKPVYVYEFCKKDVWHGTTNDNLPKNRIRYVIHRRQRKERPVIHTLVVGISRILLRVFVLRQRPVYQQLLWGAVADIV